jgi:tetratricopeptide (TPR) repeat protein
MDEMNARANVVLNFHKNDQESAKILLELLMAVDEGNDCRYYLQYGNNINTLKISETVLRFLDQKNARISTELPGITILQEMIDNDPNLLTYEGNHAVRNRAQKKSILQWNLCVFKYINLLDSFLMMEPDCVIMKNGWLKDICSAWENYAGPVFGHLKKGLIKNQYIPTHWAGCSLYDGAKLRRLPLEDYFQKRYPNPWWKYRNEAGTVTADNCFYGPVISGYDVSYDYFLFALYWKETTGLNDPYQWPLDTFEDRSDLIFCDFKTKMSADEIFQKFGGKLPLMHGVKDDAVREMMLKHFYSGSAVKLTGEKYALSGPADSPVLNNDRFLIIHDLKDKFKGKRCFIIGNGPSLNKTDMRPLKDEYTIGLNRIYLNYANMGFEPTFHCVVNPYVIEQFSQDIDAIQSIKFIRSESREYIRNRWNTFFMDSFGAHDFNQNLENLEWCEGWTVTYCAMQVAFYLGFETVILIGVDHNFPKSGDPNKLVTADGSDNNHFHPDYFGKGIKWQYPDLERSEKSYSVARKIYEKNGRGILDATVGGKLTIFPKIDYYDILSMPSNGTSAHSLNEKGEALFNSGDIPGALDAFNKAVELAPGYATAYNNLGVIYWQSGEIQKASEYFARALNIDPDDRAVIINCGRLLTSFERVEDAKKLYSTFLEKNPADEEISLLLAIL